MSGSLNPADAISTEEIRREIIDDCNLPEEIKFECGHIIGFGSLFIKEDGSYGLTVFTCGERASYRCESKKDCGEYYYFCTRHCPIIERTGEKDRCVYD